MFLHGRHLEAPSRPRVRFSNSVTPTVRPKAVWTRARPCTQVPVRTLAHLAMYPQHSPAHSARPARPTPRTVHAPHRRRFTPPALHTAGAPHRRRPTPPAPHTAGAPHRRHATPPTGMHARAASGASIYACALCFSPPVRPCAGLRHTGKPFLGRVQGALSPHLPLGAVSFDATVVLPLCCFFWLPCHETAVAP